MTAALALPPPIDLAPWRLSRDSDAYWAAVEAAAREVCGSEYDTMTLNQALRRFGYERVTVDGQRVIARNGVVKRRSNWPPGTWIWLARLKRRVEGRRA
jgi:hypothetical protein